MIPKDDKKDNKKPDPKDKKPAALDALPEGSIIIDHTRFKYMVDVFNEASNGCNEKTLKIIQILIFVLFDNCFVNLLTIVF